MKAFDELESIFGNIVSEMSKEKGPFVQTFSIIANRVMV